MYRILSICLLLTMTLKSQDKLFLRDGTVKKGLIVSKGKDLIYFKKNDTSAVEKIEKSKLLLIEDYKGARYLFSNKTAHSATDSVNPALKAKITVRNIFGMQPFGIFFGRATFVYERLSEDNKIGFVLPFSLTFDPFGTLYNSRIDTNRNALKRTKGVNFITGADVNFYVGRGEITKFFVGPRFRYGTDLFLRSIEGLTLQTQFGWKVSNPHKRFVQHLSIGLGFIRVISSPAGKLIDPKQSYAWYSLNYRLGVKW
jgi:hypothetical protein